MTGPLPWTRLGLGAAPLGNLYRAVSDEQALATVDAAWDAGIRVFDVAPHYGLGLAERRLGAALAGRPRAEYVLSTKVGRLLVPRDAAAGETDLADGGFDVLADHARVRDYSRDGVLRSIEASLGRLGTDRLDVVLVHDPDEHERQALDGAFPALLELREQGVVRAVGAGMNRSAMLTRFVRALDLDVVLLAGRYTLLDQSALADLLPAAQRAGTRVMLGGVFNSGLLAHRTPPDDAPLDYVPAPAAALARARDLAARCERHGTTLPAVAVAFALAHPAVVTALLGMAGPDQARQDATLLDAAVPAQLWADLRAAGLIRSDAPVPAPVPA